MRTTTLDPRRARETADQAEQAPERTATNLAIHELDGPGAYGGRSIDEGELMRALRSAALPLVAIVAGVTTLAWMNGRGPVHAQTSGTSTRTSARYVALQPPPAGDNTYGNFLWVLDAGTGEVVAYRIASLKDDDGKHEIWMTERLITEEEYRLSMKKNEPRKLIK
jgi:hypothetical protein